MNHKLKYLSVDELIPYAGNPRTHTSRQIEKLAKSIRAFGFIIPILIDENGMIVAGHARLLAAKRVGLETVPVIQIGHLLDAEKRAYIPSDNRLAEDAGCDENLP